MSLSSPGVHLFYHSRWQDTRVLDELCWGLEEQGVPCRAICCDEHDCALALSKLAAKSSTLRVGLGLNATGDIALTHAQLPEDRALIRGHIRAGAARLRVLGANAGQLVKVLPFSEIKQMYRIYTRTGDKGTTALFGGSRIDKDDIRVEAYGTVDELISQLGVCYASSRQAELRQDLHAIQKMLFVLGAELASDEKGLARLTQTINAEDIQALEQLIDRNMAQSGPLKEFVIPGKNLASAQLHVARTLARRLERILIAMDKKLTLRDEPRRYINRLSDALFSMARIEETTPDVCA